jgi:hypothetical protein
MAGTSNALRAEEVIAHERTHHILVHHYSGPVHNDYETYGVVILVVVYPVTQLGRVRMPSNGHNRRCVVIHITTMSNTID